MVKQDTHESLPYLLYHSTKLLCAECRDGLPVIDFRPSGRTAVLSCLTHAGKFPLRDARRWPLSVDLTSQRDTGIGTVMGDKIASIQSSSSITVELLWRRSCSGSEEECSIEMQQGDSFTNHAGQTRI